jgi:hypothetical protein
VRRERLVREEACARERVGCERADEQDEVDAIARGELAPTGGQAGLE